MIGFALCGLSLVAAGYFKAGLLVVFISFVLDKCDGELARLREQTSATGIYLDEIYHTVIPSGLFIAIGIERWVTATPSPDALLGFAVAYLVLVCRQEHKASYSVLVKSWLLCADEFRIATTSANELKYWIAVPTQDDLVLIIGAIFFLLDRTQEFLYFYLIIYSVLAILSLISALRGDLLTRVQELDPRKRER